MTGYDSSHTLKSIAQEISDTVNKELEFITSHHAKLTCAQAMVNRTMNYVSTLTPIHVLPPDILSYIFQLVRDAQPDYLDKDGNPFSQTYPETLAHVCSHWRRTAMESRQLWSHIQVSDSSCTNSNHARLIARAKAFATRADPSPAAIRIRGGSCCYDTSLTEFCTSIASRIRSFDMSAGAFGGSRTLPLQGWLENCKPGSLNELALKRSPGQFETIEASEAPGYPNSLLLQMSHEHLEQRLLSIRFLQLTGVYFHWTSQAYHGLVELRLFPLADSVNHDISQSELKAILTASPLLRELYFGLQIRGAPERTNTSVAVGLQDLEVVNMCSMTRAGQCGPVLQLLAPGSKPLQLSMNCPFTTSTPFLGNEFMEFFARSNVTKLHIESFDTENNGRYQPLVLLELLRHMTSLRALSLRCFHLGRNRTSGQPQDREPSSRVHATELNSQATPQLDIVHLRDCTIDLDYLRRVIQVVPIQDLKYQGCRFYSMTDGYSNRSNDPPPRDNLPPAFSHVSSSWPVDELDPWV